MFDLYRKPTRVLSLLALASLSLLSLPAKAQTWNPDPSLGQADHRRTLYTIARKYCDLNFDPDANLVGSYAKKPPNKKIHATRESAYYAYGLLLTGTPADNARGQAILKRVLTAQDTHTSSGTYGAFNWYFEDAKPVDMNSVAFVGLVLADIVKLDREHPCLDSDLRKQLEAATRLSVDAAIRRNIEPGYTNIAMLCIALTSAGDKLFGMHNAGQYAQAKLDAVTALAMQGEMSEYLSPTYFAVSLQGAYTARKYSFSEAFTAKTDTLIDHMWKLIAASYHAPTYQLGGPQLRAYGDNMLEYAAGLKYYLYLALDGEYPLSEVETDHSWDVPGIFMMLDVPIKPRPEFKEPTVPWREWVAVGSDGTPTRQLRQYRDGNFILGTVAYQDEWRQKRNMVAYWRTDGATPKDFNVGFCIDESNETLPKGYPGERLNFYSAQVKDAALVTLVARYVVPGDEGRSTLVFDRNAKVLGATDTSPVKVQSGAYVTYLYPVALKPVKYEWSANTRTQWLTRPWNDADLVGPYRVLAYLAVFRKSDQPAPVVSDIKLSADAKGLMAVAKVDGQTLTVSVK